MHSHFLFLADNSRPIQLMSSQEVASSAIAAFENYENRYCDDNNWARLLCIWTEDSRVIALNEGEHLPARIRSLQTYEEALTYAAQRVAIRAGLWRAPSAAISNTNHATARVFEAKRHELLIEMQNEFRRRLLDRYEPLTPRHFGHVYSPLDDGRRRELGFQFEALLQSYSAVWPLPPFSAPCSPYQEYPAISLQSYGPRDDGQQNRVILAADIHT